MIKRLKLTTIIFTTIMIMSLTIPLEAHAEIKYNEIKSAKEISYTLNESIIEHEIGNSESIIYIDDNGRISYKGNINLLGNIDDSKLDTLYYMDKNRRVVMIQNVNYIEYMMPNGYKYQTGDGPLNNKPKSDLKLCVLKGENKDADPNESKYVNDGNYKCSRFTKEDGTPYTGLYLLKDSDGMPKQWIVLDNDGFYLKEREKDEYVSAYIDGNLCIDTLYQNGRNYGTFDPLAGYKYLGRKATYQGYDIYYLVLNDWLYENGKWYHSDENGLLTKEWYKENGKWYSFDHGSGGFMRTNEWIGTPYRWYYLGSDGVMVTNQEINGHWINEEGVCNDEYYYTF